MAVTELQPGTTFADKFRVVKRLSSGGMGAVYVVEQQSTGKLRALKLMLPELAADAGLRRRFEREAQVGSLIDSDHVVEVVDAGVDASTGMPWLAMELLRGQNLRQVVDGNGALPLAAVRTILEQLCHAVGAAHMAGIVHRDLKPENIFISESRRVGGRYSVKVVDFGIARINAEATTKHTNAMGTLAWMAPEQADRQEVKPAADVWAIGLIAFYLLTARAFFDEDATVAQVMHDLLYRPIPLASDRARELDDAADRGGSEQQALRQQAPASGRLPPWFDRWFGRCVLRDPAKRIVDADEAWREFESSAAEPPHTTYSELTHHVASAISADPATRSDRRRRINRLVLLALLCVVGTFTALTAYRNHEVVPPLLGVQPGPSTADLLTKASVPTLDLDQLPLEPSIHPSAQVSAPRTVVTIPFDDAHRRAPILLPRAPSPPTPSNPPDLREQPKYDEPPAASAELPPFDRAAAAKALNETVVKVCARTDGPTGSGHVSVTFSPSGAATAAVVDGGPYPGTVTGACVASRFSASRVPPFSGMPVKVGKSFYIDPVK